MACWSDWASGSTWAATRSRRAALPLVIPADLDQVCRPVFGIRGSLPWYNFLDSPTTWDLEDYKFFFQQMAKQRFNFVGFHTYDSEPFVPYEWHGQAGGCRAAGLVADLRLGRDPRPGDEGFRLWDGRLL